MTSNVGVTFTLPFPPSINDYYRRRVKGGVYIDSTGQAFRKAVVERLSFIFKGGKPTTSDIEMQVEMYPKDRRRRDVDNILKPLLDAMEHAGVYKNDSQIKKLTIEKFEPRDKTGSVVVTITERTI